MDYLEKTLEKGCCHPEIIEIFQKAKVHLYFRYIEPVAGYTVTAKRFPFDEECETGYVLLSFRNDKTGKTVFYTSPKDAYYLSHDLNSITFADGFRGMSTMRSMRSTISGRMTG